MKRALVLIPILLFALSGCPAITGVTIAKIAVSGCRTATDMCQAGFDEAVKAKTLACNDAVCKKLDPSGGKDFQACMQKDHSANPDWKKCYEPMIVALGKWAKAKPLLLEAWQTADAAIKAAEQKKAGESVDYMTPIKKGICTLTKVAPLLPEAWQKKIKAIVAMAAGWACGDKAAPKPRATMTPAEQLQLLVRIRAVAAQALRGA